jgi:predicted transcriptional regulator of viral defense system
MDVSAREERVRQLSGRQAGRITRAQLNRVGVSDDAIRRRTENGYLKRVLPRVYAVGHDAPSREADLWAAVLYAGPGAMLSHGTAAHHRGLINDVPRVIHVSTPRMNVRSVGGRVTVHAERQIDRAHHLGIPTTTIAQTLLDLASTSAGDDRLVRRALAVLDYRNQLNSEQLIAMCGRGRRGSRTLRAAIANQQPQLAHTNGKLEERFLSLCERWRVPLPKLNCAVHGYLVDAYWPQHGLVVELDGHANHSSPAQLRRDRQRDLGLRAHGLTVVRYDWNLVTRQPQDTHADLLRQLDLASRR